MSHGPELKVGGIPPEALEEAREGILQALEALKPYMRNLTEQDRKRLRKMGRREGYVMEMFRLMEEHPEIVPASFDRESFSGTVDILDALSALIAQEHPLSEGIRDTLTWYGHVAIRFADQIYELAKTEKERGNTAITDYVSRVSRYFAGQGQKGRTMAFTIGPGEKMALDRVTAGSPMDNIGSTLLSVIRVGSSAKSIIVQPGERIELPTDYTVIEVSNMSTETGGKFRIKRRSLQ